MAAYVFVELSIKDHEGFREYVQKAPISIEIYGGKYVLRCRLTEELEGKWQSQIFVALEFPSVQRAKEWWNSSEYSEAREIRHKTAYTRMSIFESF
jgi:uncharacterized protein (DUF1330 family)